jgi:S1/P1 Nuclease
MILGTVSLLLAAGRCQAWNSTGHETVAMIAWDQLSPDARVKLVAVLDNHPRLKEDLLADISPDEPKDVATFIRAATWPDMVRYPMNPLHQTEHHPKWHYIDYPVEMDGVHGQPQKETWDGHDDPANILQAYQKCLGELKDPATTKDRKAIDLCWVEHLVGDIHQPLHATALYSKEFPQGDQGGNLEFIHDPNSDFPTEALHTYWDDLEGLSLKYDDIRKTADRLEKEHPADTLKDQVADLSMLDWAHESYELARKVAYANGTLPHAGKQEALQNAKLAPTLSAQYIQDAQATADLRVALGGYRLGAVLEDAAKTLDQTPSK